MGSSSSKSRRPNSRKRRRTIHVTALNAPGNNNTIVEDKSKHLNAKDIISLDGLEDDDVSDDEYNDLFQYEYPFDNIVFEGGGSKGMAYCGAIQVLEELGIKDEVRRVAGTSAGAFSAALFAVGFSAAHITQCMDEDIVGVLNDHSCGLCSLIPSLLRKYGWNSSRRLREWLGDKFRDIGAPEDITFNQVLKMYGRELCIVVTNVSMMTAEYCHPKTTPDLPVRDAVCMSMAIPVFFQAFHRDLYNCDRLDTYVDGGLLCNYPIKCYDGWWLSMEPDDSFFKRLNKLENLPKLFDNKVRFGTYNDKTLGFMVFSDDQKDFLRESIETRSRGVVGPGEIPNTKLGNKYRAKQKTQAQEEKRSQGNRKHTEKAMQAFLDALFHSDQNSNSTIDLEELRTALEHKEFRKYKKYLFDENATAEDIMYELDADGSNEIEFRELDRFLGRKGFSLTSKLLGYNRTHIKSFRSFLVSIEEALILNVQRLYVDEEDAKRTVGINTGYIGTTDFLIEDGDKEYLINQGRKATEGFLKGYIKTHNPPMKKQTTKQDGNRRFDQRAKSIAKTKTLLTTNVTSKGGVSQTAVTRDLPHLKSDEATITTKRVSNDTVSNKAVMNNQAKRVSNDASRITNGTSSGAEPNNRGYYGSDESNGTLREAMGISKKKSNGVAMPHMTVKSKKQNENTKNGVVNRRLSDVEEFKLPNEL